MNSASDALTVWVALQRLFLKPYKTREDMRGIAVLRYKFARYPKAVRVDASKQGAIQFPHLSRR